jgi:penicillin-binding protein 1A
MEYAHQGIELKNLPGLPPNPSPTAPVAQNGNKNDTPHPAMLTYRGAQVLVRVEHMMEDAKAALPAATPAAASAPADHRAAVEHDTGPFAAAHATSGD